MPECCYADESAAGEKFVPDENGKTLGGKTVQLSNKAEFDELRKMVVAAGGKK